MSHPLQSPLGKENATSVVMDEEIKFVNDSLQKIENILKAESKRRMEANQLTEDYILNYLDTLEQNLYKRVSGQFQEMDDRIRTLDSALTKIEVQFEQQDNRVTNLIEQKTEKSKTTLKDAEMLLFNV